MSDHEVTRGATRITRLKKLLEFDSTDWGSWHIPIDNVDGELCSPKNAARLVEVLESEPVDKYHARLKPLLDAMVECANALENYRTQWTPNASYALNKLDEAIEAAGKE